MKRNHVEAPQNDMSNAPRVKDIFLYVRIFPSRPLTKNEQKKMNDTKYAYAIGDPHSSPTLPDFASHGPLRHANIMFGHASPVAHLELSTEGGWGRR